jgi:precorrin-6B methylase 2
LLDALVAMELLEKTDDAYRAPPVAAEAMVEGAPNSILSGLRHLSNCLRRWSELARVVRTNRPAERKPSIRGEAADTEAFIGAMDNFTASIAPAVVEKLSPLSFSRLLDVGGASGTWTIAFLRTVPVATAVLFDLADVVPLARHRLARAGLADRVTLVAGDYNSDELPGGADFAWLSAIAHQNSRAQNGALYAKIHAALAAGGVLIVRDVVLDASRTAPRAGALFAVNMLVNTEGGNSYTFSEFREDLESAGFAEVELLVKDDAMNSLIRARKA